ncbi:MAG: ribulose-phosphate 3-epimerase [Acidimicrobiia bacterium]
MRHAVRIAPSILAADFAQLGAEIDGVAGVVDLLHVDVMDGHFVPNISLGPPVLASLRAHTDLYLDCHLMISDPVRYLTQLKDAGADGVTAHVEAIPDPRPFLAEARNLGLNAGLVINPPTPPSAVEPFLDQCDKVVVMSVHPGFGGQSFIEDSVPKIASLRESIDSRALATDIEVDGGVDIRTAGSVWAAGADILVAGTAVFRASDPVAAVGEIRRVCESRVTNE